jgi:hypothetical protein
MKVRSFIYLDEYKLYSFSSQVFKGLTEHVVESFQRSREHRQRQESLSTDAKLVAEIALEESITHEKKFLHDHAYNLFESELIERTGISDVSEESETSDFEDVKFIRVSGPAFFIDAPLLKRTVENFNPLVEALAYVTKYGELKRSKELLEAVQIATKDRNQQAKNREATKLPSPKQLAKEAGMSQDSIFMEQLAHLIDSGYGDQLQIQVYPKAENIESLVFSGVLKREFLRERGDILIQKYARLTDRTHGSKLRKHSQNQPHTDRIVLFA